MKHTMLRILSLLIITVLLCFALPLTAGAASVSTESALRTNVNKGGTVKLTKDIKLSARLVIPGGKTVTIDLNGKKLYRELTECKEDGNVILVEERASLTLTDTLKAHGGTITGGVAPQGGGIFNRGNLTVNHGVRIIGNCANSAYAVGVPGERDREDKGGGIYNDEHASLALCGGQISDNEAYFGGGVYSAVDSGLTVRSGSYTEVVDGVKKTLESNVTVTGNRAACGAGIFSEAGLALSGAAEINGNEGDDDIRMESGLKITCGALTYTTPIGVSVEGLEAAASYTFTSGFGANNTGLAEKYFFCPDRSVTLKLTSAQNGEIRLNKDMQKTVVEFYEKGSLVKIEEYDSPADAWKAAGKCEKNSVHFSFENAEKANGAGKDWWPKYRTDSEQFKKWLDNVVEIIEDNENNVGKKRHHDGFYTGSLQMSDMTLLKDHTVKITLGSDWILTGSQSVDRLCDVTIDLNGHSVRRVEKSKNDALPAGVIASSSGGSDGNLFDLAECARLTILDSNPYSDGYDGVRGGVITGGDGDDVGGCFVLKKKFAELNILGGTVYNCKTDKHGGAVYVDARGCKVNLKDCAFVLCSTEDSSDDCNGGAIWIRDAILLTADNVTFDRCASEDNGGAIWLENRPGHVKMQNVSFDKNQALDNGGAIGIGDIDGKKRFLFEAADCSFTDNLARVDGGAVIVKDNDDSDYKEPIIFRNCTFTENSARDGSALELDDNSVALLSCSITGNTANRRGAVYVNDSRAVNVGGTTVIKDNEGQNLILDKDGNKTRIYPVGLIEGAEIIVSSDSGDKSTLVMKDIDQRQLRYFRGENAELEFKKTGEKEAKMVVASLFGSGALWLVIAIAGAAVAAAAFIVIKKKRDGRKTEHDA